MLDKNNCDKTGWVNDYEMLDGEKIIAVNSFDFSDWKNIKNVIPYHKNILMLDENGKAILKPIEVQKQEKYKLLVSTVLNDAYLKAMIEGMEKQLLMKNILSIDKKNAIFEDSDCVEWINKYYSIVKDDIDISELSIEDININIFNFPKIPKVFSSRFPVVGILVG